MKYSFIRALAVFIFLIFCQKVNSQYAWYHQWGLLRDSIIDYFIGESSGERAYNHIAELSEYNRQRKPAEFSDALMESQYVVDRLKEYGLSEVKIERLGKTNSWHGITGTLWETSPNFEKIADINDMPFSLATVSSNADVEADLVYIGDPLSNEVDKMDLAGKVVLTPARSGTVLNMVTRKNGVGFISYYSPRPLENPIMIPDSKGGGGLRSGTQSQIVGFNLPPRDGIVLRDRLLRGEKIRVHAIVKTRSEEIDLQVPTCVITGTNPQAGEIIISAHLFEGYGVQGANDNISGAAAILETARVIRKLISDGIIAPPKRSIRFIWVPEYSGTIPWVKAHKDIVKNTLCDLNLDMVGLSLSKYKSSLILHRTSYGNAHFLNDVLENYYRYVGETNQINSVVSGTRFFKRIVAPTGTDDPFHYLIESSSGGSDHDVFNDWGVQVPGVLMITWPDPFYHTSQDRIDKCDPTQLKRVVFITAISAYTIASAGESEAFNISGEVYGNATRRLGYQVSKSFDEINKSDADNFPAVLKRAVGNLKGVALGEEMVIKSVSELAPSSARLKELLGQKAKSLRDIAEVQINNLIKTAGYIADDFGIPKQAINLTPEEKNAAGIIPSLITDIRDLGYRGFNDRVNKIPSDVRNKYKVMNVADISEACKLINGSNSVLDIKYIIDSQESDETSVDGLLNYFSLLKEAGIIKF